MLKISIPRRPAHSAAKAAGVMLCALLLAGCAANPKHDIDIVFGKSKFYRFAPVATPFYAAKVQCQPYLINRLLGVDAFVACMADRGWLPCHEGGEGRPECKSEEGE